MKVTIKNKNFVWNDSKAHFVLDTAWTLPELSLNDVRYYLDVRKNQGFNAVMFGPENRYLDENYNWSNNYIQKLEKIMEFIQERGMWAVPGVSCVIYRDGKPHSFIPTDKADYVARKYTEIFRKYKNIWFHFADAFDARKVNGEWVEQYLLRYYANALTKGIRKEDSQVLIALHPAHSFSSIHPLFGLPLSDHNNFITLQSGHNHGRDPNYVQKLYDDAWKEEPNALVFNMEPCYEGYADVTTQDVKKIAEVDRRNGPSIAHGNIEVAVFMNNWKDSLHDVGAQYVLEEARKMGTPTWFREISNSGSSSNKSNLDESRRLIISKLDHMQNILERAKEITNNATCNN